jgi:hypothetical protein
MDEEANDSLYPKGVHTSIKEGTFFYAIAIAVYTQTSDPVDAVHFLDDDERVCTVSTCGSAYYAIAKKFNESPPGLVIGDEYDGVEEEWQTLLGWSSEYGP